MIEIITTTHSNINQSLSNLVSAKQFLDSDRPLKEVLNLVDNALANIHDAKTSMLKFREMLRDKNTEQIKPDGH